MDSAQNRNGSGEVNGMMAELEAAATANDALAAVMGMKEAFPDMDEAVMEYFATFGLQRGRDRELLGAYLLALSDKKSGMEQRDALLRELGRMDEFTRLLK